MLTDVFDLAILYRNTNQHKSHTNLSNLSGSGVGTQVAFTGTSNSSHGVLHVASPATSCSFSPNTTSGRATNSTDTEDRRRMAFKQFTKEEVARHNKQGDLVRGLHTSL